MSKDRENRAARAEQMRKEREKAAKRQRNIITVVIVGVVVVLIGLAGYGIKQFNDDKAERNKVVVPANTVDDGVVYPAEGEAADGVPVVEMYEDFLCSHCAQFEQSDGPAYLKQAAAEGEIELRFVPMTIMDGPLADNGQAHDVMNAAMCAADEQGGEAFWTAHEALFAAGYGLGVQQPTADSITQVIEGAGLSGLDDCLTNGRFVPWLNEVRERGRERGVEGTPSVFINGEASEARTAADLAAAIEAAK